MRTLLLLAAMCSVCLALPYKKLQKTKLEKTKKQDDRTVTDLIYEVNNKGPIVFGEYVVGDLDIAYSNKRNGNGCPNNICLWRKSYDGNVYIPYIISSDYSESDSQVIQSAMKDIERPTCIRYIKQTSEDDYISYQSRDGCHSPLGQMGGEQIVSLDSSGCVAKGIAIHESLHALGLHHEHMRSDRDNYVKVLWDNIQDGYAYAFKKIETYNVNLTTYDYGSIMHYSRYSFAKHLTSTLEAIPNNGVIFGQRVGLSDLDIQKINSLYKCSDGPSTMTTPTPTTVSSNACNSTVKLTARRGVITSPNFPNNYTNSVHCFWNITTTNFQLKVNFTDFDIDGNINTNCNHDGLYIYKGRYMFAAYQKLFCGQTVPPPLILQSNAMQVMFISDSTVSGKGFRIEYGPA